MYRYNFENFSYIIVFKIVTVLLKMYVEWHTKRQVYIKKE